MSKNGQTQCFMHVWFVGNMEPVPFRIGEDDLNLFQGDYQNDRDSYFVWDTLNGMYTAINLKHVAMAHLSHVLCPAPAREPKYDALLEVHLLNQPPGVIDIDNLACLGRLFVQLENAVTVPQEVISLRVSCGSVLMIDPTAVMYLRAPSRAVNDGKKIMNIE
jgi:hypothetical protein